MTIIYYDCICECNIDSFSMKNIFCSDCANFYWDRIRDKIECKIIILALIKASGG